MESRAGRGLPACQPGLSPLLTSREMLTRKKKPTMKRTIECQVSWVSSSMHGLSTTAGTWEEAGGHS